MSANANFSFCPIWKTVPLMHSSFFLKFPAPPLLLDSKSIAVKPAHFCVFGMPQGQYTTGVEWVAEVSNGFEREVKLEGTKHCGTPWVIVVEDL